MPEARALLARLSTLLLLATAFSTAVACGREVVQEVPAKPEKVSEAPQPAGTLVVYSGRSDSLVGPIIDQFRQLSGVDVSVKYGDTPELAATILEEGENSPADVFFAQDPGGLGAVDQAGLLAELPQDILAPVPDWARSPQGTWVGISGRARTVVYNTSRLSEEDLPDTMFGFTDPRWKGRIGWAPSNASFQAMVTAMRVLWGEEKAAQWLRGIQINQPKVYLKNTPIVEAVASGEIDVGFVNHYYLYPFIQERGEEFPARNYHVREGGPGAVVLVAGAGILKTAKNRDNAEEFLRFLLSKVAQQYFAAKTYEYPLVDGVTTHGLLMPLASIGSPAIDMAALADLKRTQALLRNLGILS